MTFQTGRLLMRKQVSFALKPYFLRFSDSDESKKPAGFWPAGDLMAALATPR
jgi:hypothetical protein